MTVPYPLMYAALFTTFDSMNLIFSFALKGAGDTLCLPRSAHAALAIMVLPTILMREWEGAVFWAWGAASVFGITQALVFCHRFLGGKWKSMGVIGSLDPEGSPSQPSVA